MPATARMATPMFLALLVWVIFNVQGIKHQGPLGYFKGVLFPPGVPKALYVLVTPIEFISTLIVRPFSLAVRLFANMLAGHLLLVIFALLSEALFQARDLQKITALLNKLATSSNREVKQFAIERSKAISQMLQQQQQALAAATQQAGGPKA